MDIFGGQMLMKSVKMAHDLNYNYALLRCEIWQYNNFADSFSLVYHCHM